MNELALFAGAGGSILGGKLLGWRTVCAVELDAYAAAVLAQRQNDGLIEPFPIWSDITTFDGRPWRGLVDVVSGGFPCQDISCAGKGRGIAGERSGLWAEMARVVREVGPRHVFVENSPMLTSRGLGVVLGDLAEMGFDARWAVLGAHHAGAPHKRDRIWIVGYARGIGQTARGYDHGRHDGQVASATDKHAVHVAHAARERGQRRRLPIRSREPFKTAPDAQGSGQEGWWLSEPELGRVANGVAYRVDRLKAIGNGQVPAVVRLAWRVLSQL